MSRLLRITEVTKKTGLAKSTIWMMSKEKRFPSPLTISPRVTVWKESDIDEWIEGICNENNKLQTVKK